MLAFSSNVVKTFYIKTTGPSHSHLCLQMNTTCVIQGPGPSALADIKTGLGEIQERLWDMVYELHDGHQSLLLYVCPCIKSGTEVKLVFSTISKL